jgi:hypothetical protein
LVRGFSQIEKTITISFREKKEFLTGRKINNSILKLKTRIGNNSFDRIFYPHDVDGGMFAFICNAYPNAERICYGDAFGFVFEREYLLGLIHTSSFKKILGKINKFRKKVLSGLSLYNVNLSYKLKTFNPDMAALILPVDQSGNFLKELPLHVSSNQKVKFVINTINDNLGQLNQYIKLLLSESIKENKYLLLTENNAECNFIGFEKEIEMYCSIIIDKCEESSVIFIKSHPGEFLPRNERIKEKLGGKYKIIELDPVYKRYPIELWRALLSNIKIICMSSPILSLKFLYNIDVINPMTDDFIERWFPEFMWDSYKNAITLYMEPLKRLNYWNGKDVLYSGERK